MSDATSARAVVRIVAIVVASAVALYLVYLLRRPILWLVLATFLAIAASGPVNFLDRRMRRGLAITIVYLGIVLAPIAIGAILLPPVISGGVTLVRNLPGYVRDLDAALDKSQRFRQINEDYQVTQKLSDLATSAVRRVGAAAGALGRISASLIGSLFAIFTVIVLSMFMVARGRGWVDAALARREGAGGETLRRIADRTAVAVGNYMVGALVQATVAGLAAFLVLTILGVPSALALGVVVAIFDLLPLVGATVGAVIVGIVTLFHDFPLATIVWAVFAIAYQQFENYVIQPQIQKRAVALDPFIVLVAVLFGGTLMGVIGAVLAIPVAATIGIAIQEYRMFRLDPAGPVPVVERPPGGW